MKFNFNDISQKFFYGTLLVFKDLSFFTLLFFASVISAFLFSSLMPATEYLKIAMFFSIAIVMETIKAYALVMSNSFKDCSSSIRPEKIKKEEDKKDAVISKKKTLGLARYNFIIYLLFASLSIMASYAFSLYSVHDVGDDVAVIQKQTTVDNFNEQIKSIDQRIALNTQSLIDLKETNKSLVDDYDKQIADYRKQLLQPDANKPNLNYAINQFITRKNIANEKYLKDKETLNNKIQEDSTKKSDLIENMGKSNIENVSGKVKSTNVYEMLGQALFGIGQKNAMFLMLILLSIIVELGTYFTSPHPHFKEVIKNKELTRFSYDIYNSEDLKELKQKTKTVIKEVFVDRPIETIKEVEVIKEVFVDRPVEVIKEIEVIKEVFVDRPVEVIKEIEVIKEVIVEVIKEVEKTAADIKEEQIIDVKAEVPLTIIDPTFAPDLNNEEQYITNNKGIDELTSWVKKEVRELEPLRAEKQRMGK